MRRRSTLVPPAGLELCDLRAVLCDAGYTAAELKRLLGIAYPDDVGVLNRAAAQARAAAETSAAAILTRLLFLEEDVAAAPLARVLSRRRCAVWVEAGLLESRGEALRARMRVDPVGSQHFVGDRRFRRPDRRALRLPAGDQVYPPGADSLMLREAVVLDGAARVLDLCSGSGVQAVHPGLGEAESVVAIDVNSRAVALTRLNAAVNGHDNVSARHGDLYAPVRRESFDAIVANPPFVASPYVGGPSYHAGGPTGDRVLRRIVRGWGSRLCPGGRAFAISHVALRRGETMEGVADGWFRGFPGRGCVVVLETGTPIDLAAAQALFALERGIDAYGREVRRWLDYLRAHRIHAVSLVFVAAERTGTRTGVEVVDGSPRVLPIPLSPALPQRVRSWLGMRTVGEAENPA